MGSALKLVGKRRCHIPVNADANLFLNLLFHHATICSIKFKEAKQVTLVSKCNMRKFRAVFLAFAPSVLAWGRGNYAHLSQYKPIMT